MKITDWSVAGWEGGDTKMFFINDFVQFVHRGHDKKYFIWRDRRKIIVQICW